MNYIEITEKEKKEFILDDSNIKETLNIISELIGTNLDIEIKNEEELINFLDNPGNYLNNEETIIQIRELKELIIKMSGIYYA